MNSDHIEIVPADTGYVWRFVARNGRTSRDSEASETRHHAVRAAKSHLDCVAVMLGVALIYTTQRSGGATRLYASIALA